MPTRVFSSLLFAAFIALADISTSGASETTQGRKAICLEAVHSNARNSLQRIVLELESDGIEVKAIFSSAQKVPFFGRAMCTTNHEAATNNHETLKCSIECDGGTGLLSLKGNAVELQSTLRLNTRVETAIPGNFINSYNLNGTFIFKPVNFGVCTAAFAPTYGHTELRRGDALPRVKSLKKTLANAGYDVSSADWHFDEKTEKRLREFQRDANLPVTGVADANTIRRLKLLADRPSGC